MTLGKKKQSKKTSPITTVSTGGKVGEVPTSVTVSTYPGPKYLCGNGWLDEAFKLPLAKPAFKSVAQEELEHQQEDDANTANWLVRQALESEEGKSGPKDGITEVEAGVDGRIRVTVRFPGKKYPRDTIEHKDHHTRKYILTVEEEKPRLALGDWISSANSWY